MTPRALAAYVDLNHSMVRVAGYITNNAFWFLYVLTYHETRWGHGWSVKNLKNVGAVLCPPYPPTPTNGCTGSCVQIQTYAGPRCARNFPTWEAAWDSCVKLASKAAYGATSLEQFATLLKKSGYYEEKVSDYLKGLRNAGINIVNKELNK